MKLVLLTLESIITQYEQNFYEQLNGIIIDDNHSFLLANIAMHFATTPALPILKNPAMYKRLIDDVIFITIGENSTQTKLIIKALENSHETVGIKITTKSFDTKFTDQQIEISHVLHKHSAESSFNFVTCNYLKQTTIDKTFIIGTSYHQYGYFNLS